MSLTVNEITSANSNEQLFKLLSSELNERLGAIRKDLNEHVRFIRTLPRGLHAMAAIQRLDISMAIDDLGWHFHNFHHRELSEETLAGLRELEATEAAEIFHKAMVLTEPHWEKIGGAEFEEWYAESGLEKSIEPLNKELWALCEQSRDYGLLNFWLGYARKYPERILEN